MFYTILTLCLVKLAINIIYWAKSNSIKKIKEKAFRLALYLPPVKSYIDQKLKKVVDGFDSKFKKMREGKTTPVLPEHGMSMESIVQK